MPSGKKPLPEPIFTKLNDAIWDCSIEILQTFFLSSKSVIILYVSSQRVMTLMYVTLSLVGWAHSQNDSCKCSYRLKKKVNWPVKLSYIGGWLTVISSLNPVTFTDIFHELCGDTVIHLAFIQHACGSAYLNQLSMWMCESYHQCDHYSWWGTDNWQKKIWWNCCLTWNVSS